MIFRYRTTTYPDLTEDELSGMYEIMTEMFDRVQKKQLFSDLQKTDNIILFYHIKSICGFTSFKTFDLCVRKKVSIIFSDETVMKKEYWGTLSLPMAFSRSILEVKEKNPDRDYYWFLTTKGYRTYRFLPVFFKDYYPRYDKITPEFELKLIQDSGKKLFQGRFDIEKCIYRAQNDDYNLKREFGNSGMAYLHDKHIAFFFKANPGHFKGDELACIAKLEKSNIKDSLLKRLGFREQVTLQPKTP